MRGNSLTLLWALLLVACGDAPPRPVHGAVDLSRHDLRQAVPLAGRWDELPELPMAPDTPSTFEGRWPKDEDGPFPGMGGRLSLSLPPTTPERPPALYIRSVCAPFRVDVLGPDGEPLMPAITGGSLRPPVRTNTDRVVPLPPARELVLEVRSADAACRSADPKIVVGDERTLEADLSGARQEAWLVAGVMLITGLYHLVLYALRRTERAPLWLGLFGLAMCVRIWSRYEGIEARVPGFDDHALHVALEFGSFYLAVPVFAAYLHEILPREMPRYVVRVSMAVMVTLSWALWLGPAAWTYPTLALAEYTTLIFGPLAVWAVLRAWRRRNDREVMRWVGAGTACLVGFTVVQIVSNRVNYAPLPMEQWAMASFVFCQSAVLAVLNGRARHQAEALAVELVRTNTSLARFVPAPLLRMLGKPDLTQLALGDQLEREMTVLFCDIRGFTGISERLDARGTFELLNRCLTRVAPIVRQHNGFIDKYIGDSMMALFPGDPGDAVRAAVAIARALEQLPGEPRIVMGFGIHTGPVMLGMIGEAARLEGTVISDAVNIAARLEGLTRQLGASVLLSEDTWRRIPSIELPYRHLGRIRVAGKLRAVRVVEIGRSASPELKRAIELFGLGQLEEAGELFEAALRAQPDDPVAQVFHQACVRGDTIARDGTLRLEK